MTWPPAPRLLAAAFALASLYPASAQAPANGRRIAITLDDGPVVGELKDLERFQRIAAALLGSLQAEKIPATIFINERQLNVEGQRDARVAVLANWLDAGYDLGNHTYSHPSLNKIPLWQFEDNVVQGEVIIRALMAEHGRRLVWFRFPFLDCGPTPETRQKFLDFLDQHHYRIAPVTVDYKDYMFAGPYSRTLRAGKPDVAEKIRQAYLSVIDVEFGEAERISRDLFGYELPQILLIHCSELNSVSLRDSIAIMRQRGYSFITLEEAMSDPAYAGPGKYVSDGGSWFELTADTIGKHVVDDAEGRVPKWVTESGRSSR
jgi:peptidoglycan/xylan/chitin deacetylase (PgdA/CDA1 family)